MHTVSLTDNDFYFIHVLVVFLLSLSFLFFREIDHIEGCWQIKVCSWFDLP